MNRNQHGWLLRLVTFMLVIGMIIPLLIACDDDDDEITTTSPATTPADTTTQPTTTTTSDTPPAPSGEPVKIGAITAWSGAAGMAGLLADAVLEVVEDQVEARGGVLGRRPLEIVTFDNGSAVAKSRSGAIKLALDDEVSAIVWGGASGAETEATLDAAHEQEVPFFTFGASPEDLSDLPYAVRCIYRPVAQIDQTTDFILNVLKPDTVAILADEGTTQRRLLERGKETLEAGGIDIVREDWVHFDIKDLAPMLTSIKADDPDVLLVWLVTQEKNQLIFKQIPELGGFDGEVISAAPSSSGLTVVRMPGAEGSYHWVMWAPGVDYPAAREFEEAFKDKHGSLPSTTHAFFYFSLWTAIHAIELAGSDDPQDVVEAARSGNLSWDSPAGPLTIDVDGETNLEGFVVQVQDGKLVIP